GCRGLGASLPMRRTASWFRSLDLPHTRLWRDSTALESGLPSDCHPDCTIVLEAVRMRPGEIEPRTRRWKKCVTLLDSKSPIQGTLATVLGVGALMFAAVGVVVQLKDALNTVWEVEPPKASGIWDFVRTYMVSLAAVLSLGFLLLVSLLLTTALAAGGKYIAPYVPELAMHALGSLVSFGMITLVFAMMFKWLPDTYVAWRDVWLGAAVTAALFEVGKLLIGL